MLKGLALTSLLISSITLTACATLTPPVRPDYKGADIVQNAKPAQLLGVWTVTELNPYPETESQDTTIEYRADGSVQGLIIPQGQSAKALGEMSFKLSGQWTLNGDTVTHENMQMESTEDNLMGSMISQLMRNQNGLSGQANIYELSANRIVLVGSDGAAMEYRRK